MKQREIFLEGEGRAWIERNPGASDYDPVTPALKHNLPHDFKPQKILEVGCGDGWRLRKLVERYPEAVVAGVDPGMPPVMGPPVYIGKLTADMMPYDSGIFDLLIYAFCLYLCDPEDYFRIVAEGDRVLADGGFLVIHDFDMAPYEDPYRTPYKHREGVWSHHVSFHNLWRANPVYRVISHTRGERDDAVYILRKDLQGAFEQR